MGELESWGDKHVDFYWVWGNVELEIDYEEVFDWDSTDVCTS